MRELVHRDKKIRAVSYKLNDGSWIARAEVMSTASGAHNPHVINGSKPYPTQQAADDAALQMGESWIDAHNPPKLKVAC